MPHVCRDDITVTTHLRLIFQKKDEFFKFWDMLVSLTYLPGLVDRPELDGCGNHKVLTLPCM